MELHGLAGSVLLNPLILDKIFFFSPSLKSLRLVCATWNEVVLSGPHPPRLSLNFHSLPGIPHLEAQNGSEGILETLMLSLDPRLTKSIALDKLKTKDVGKQSYQILEKFFQLCSRFRAHIQELEVTWSSEIISILDRIMEFCSNIRILSLRFIELESFTPHYYLRTNGSYSLQPNPRLKVISISQFRDWPYPPSWKCITAFSIFADNLIAAAPKLEQLTLESLFCPGLKNKTELSQFHFHLIAYPIEILPKRRRHFDLCSITAALEQVQGSLTHLTLRSDCGKHSSCERCIPPAEDFKLPPLPKLKTFEVLSPTVFNVYANPEMVGRERMPALEELYFPAAGLLQHLLKGRDIAVKELTIGMSGQESIQTVSDLKMEAFPNLVRLNLTLICGQQGDGGLRVGLESVLKSCSTLGLTHLRLDTLFSPAFSDMVQGLWECRAQLFSELKCLEIVNCEENKVRDDLSPDGEDKFEGALMLSKGMERVLFGGILLRESYSQRIINFITCHDLPVDFE